MDDLFQSNLTLAERFPALLYRLRHGHLPSKHLDQQQLILRGQRYWVYHEILDLGIHQTLDLLTPLRAAGRQQ